MLEPAKAGVEWKTTWRGLEFAEEGGVEVGQSDSYQHRMHRDHLALLQAPSGCNLPVYPPCLAILYHVIGFVRFFL